MKKAIITVAVLLAAAGISMGAFLAIKSNSEQEIKKEESSQADNVLFELNPDNINKLDITNADGSYTVEFIDDKWILTENTGTPFDVNQITVQGVCTSVSILTADTSYGEVNEENKEKYGLIDPYIVTVYDDEASHTLYIGNESPTGEYYYGYTDEKNNIYAIPAADARAILTTRLSLKDNNLIPYGDNEIIGLKLIRDGETVYELNYDTKKSFWTLPDKYETLTVNQPKVSNIVTLLTRLTANEMLPETDEDFTKYGFDKPFAEFVVKSSDGTEKTLLLSRYGSQADVFTHVYIEEAKQVETYYTADLDFAEAELFDFVLNNIELANMNAVSEFEIISEDVNEKININAAEGWAECRGTRIELNNAEISGYFENFYNLFSYVRLVDINVDVQPELTDPVFTAKYVLNDGTETKVDFVSAEGSDNCFVFVDDEYTGTLSGNQFIYGDDSVSAAFNLLCRQAGIK